MAGNVVPLSEQMLSAHDTYDHQSPPIGKPRLKATERLLHRFYEPLVLLSIVERNPGERGLKSDSMLSTTDHPRIWGKFLDHISWLCDYESGGTTVSSVAVQATTQGPTYWLAANSNPVPKASTHLEWVLQKLSNLQGLLPDQLQMVEDEIVARSIAFSADKVKFYSRRLGNSIKYVVKESAKSPAETDLQLLEDLQSLLQLGDKHYELCELASPFKSLANLNELCRKHPTTTRRTAWSNIRHYIGRLGSWSKASKIIVRVAKRRPELVENFRVKCLTPPTRINLPAADHQTRLEGVLQRMFPKNERDRLEQMQVVLRSSRILNFETEFLEKYTSKNFAPRWHAEVILLEHLYVNKLEFFGNQRYIGCSKPSCYCCDLYMKFHPGNFVRRPCHGNVWANWCVPGLAIDDNSAMPWHVKRILTQMIEHVRRDALFLIMSKLPPRARVRSSTTALSTLSALSKLSININALGSSPPASHDGTVEILDDPNEDDDESEIDDLDYVGETWAGRAIATDSGTSETERGVMCDRGSLTLTKRATEASRRESVGSGELHRWSGRSPVATDDEDTIVFSGRKRQKI